MRWTTENTETLKALWTEGLSASQIAKRIGGLSRNAVIGKIHRLGLGGRRRQPRVRRRAIVRAAASRPQNGKRFAARTPRLIAADVPPLEEAPSSPVTIMTLTRGLCHWPEGDPRDPAFHYCGRPASPNGPYCPHHARRAYRPPGAEAEGVRDASHSPPRARPSRRALLISGDPS